MQYQKHGKFLAGLSLSLFCCVGVNAEDLMIKAGAHYQITKANLVLDSFEVGDGATVSAAADIQGLSISADRMRIGDDVRFDFTGVMGEAGASAEALGAAADRCQAGQAGDAGMPGGAGGSGLSVAINATLLELGSLVIDVSGGAGGTGGRGAKGQDAGTGGRCNGKNGGAGGAGGAAGRGGNGGDIHLVLRPGPGIAADVVNRIKLITASGASGEAGLGAQGGKGAAGRYISTAVGSGKKWLPSGDNGQNGAMGTSASEGVTGRVLAFRLGDAAMMESSAQQEVSDSARDQAQLELDALLKRLQKLEARVLKLEASR